MVQKGVCKRKEEDLIKAFQEADKNHDGFLSMEEYVKVFSKHGVNISKEEVGLYFSSKDKDRDGLISYTEFCGRKTTNEKAFEALDINSDGYISKQELLVASQRTGRRLSKPDVEATFKEFDQNKDNKLSYKEFCVMMNRKKGSVKEKSGESKSRGSSRGSSRCSSRRGSTVTTTTTADEGSSSSSSTDPSQKYIVK